MIGKPPKLLRSIRNFELSSSFLGSQIPVRFSEWWKPEALEEIFFLVFLSMRMAFLRGKERDFPKSRFVLGVSIPGKRCSVCAVVEVDLEGASTPLPPLAERERKASRMTGQAEPHFKKEKGWERERVDSTQMTFSAPINLFYPQPANLKSECSEISPSILI